MNQENETNATQYETGQYCICKKLAYIRTPVESSGTSVSYLCTSYMKPRPIAVLLEYVKKLDIKTEAWYQ
ncbi:hypothetical protein [Candidatus Nitrosotalea okcheonensis]|uniref:hypothetical protein n=1 Tax=Candidatus Nitrosotalea okcheonensis TaxID=1903276 RepID=UPI0013001504|nr:hypothetical protein [Candidatus Nitrosotalea okcheonensis]